MMVQSYYDLIDPSTSPYFRAQDLGSGSTTMGAGDGSGWLDWSQIPGFEGYTFGADNVSGTRGPDLAALLGERGYRLTQRQIGGGDGYNGGVYERGVIDANGNFVGSPQRIETASDRGFWNGALAAAALAGGAASGYGGAGAEAAVAPGGAGGASGAAGAAGGAGMSWFDWAQLASSAVQANQARRAQDAQVGAARDATALQERQFNQIRDDQAPYRSAGYAALDDLMGMRGGPSMTAEDVMSEPGYEFARLQGLRGIEGSAAARGMALSGSALKNAARFNSDYASTRFSDAWNRRQADFGNRWGRLSALAGIGQTATQQTGQAGMQFGAMGGNNMMGAGNAAAAGAITRGNIYGNAINQGLSMYGRQRPVSGGYVGQTGWSSDASADPYYMGG